jgi:hypothetical protein
MCSDCPRLTQFISTIIQTNIIQNQKGVPMENFGLPRADGGTVMRSFVHLGFIAVVGSIIFCLEATAQFAQQGGKLLGNDAIGAAGQGQSVALSSDGNTAIVGGYGDNSGVGAAWVFTRSGGVWTHQGSNLVGTGAVGAAVQGQSVSLSSDGNTAIVGALGDNSNAGAAWVWTRSGGVWTQQGNKLFGTGAVGNAYQGTSVSLSSDGNTAIVGGDNDNGSAGAVWLFARSGGVWTQQGSKLVGTGAVSIAYQGQCVSLSSDGNTAIEGGHGDNSSTGAAWVFTRSGGVWTQQGSKLVGTTVYSGAGQGTSVSLSSDGNSGIVGGFSDNGYTGAVWVWTRSAGVWTQQGSRLVGTGAVGEAGQGQSVALSSDGNTAISGGANDNTGVGASWVFKFPAEPLITSVKDLPGDQGGKVRIAWNSSIYDALGSTHQITSYGVWRKVPDAQSVGLTSAPTKLMKTTGVEISGTYDFIGTVPAVQFTKYTYVAPTLSDSTSSGSPYYTFVVSAHTSDVTVTYFSDPDSSYSVDNIPPSTPGGPVLVPLANGPMKISWNRDRTDPDVGHYDVYRSMSNGFSIDPSTLLKSTTDTTATDSTTTIGQTYYYRVTTVDIHDNQSTPTSQLGNTALALELASFSAISAGSDGVILSWTMATETNVYGYTVERRQDHEMAFQSVANGFIVGHGTNSSPQAYSF